jgi:hypothetical protein
MIFEKQPSAISDQTVERWTGKLVDMGPDAGADPKGNKRHLCCKERV